MDVSVNDTRLYFDVDGAQMRVREGTLAAVPTIVALHGGPGFDQGYLRPGLGPLRDLAQVIFVDLRGQGRSDPVPAETCSLEQMADDVIALCGRLGVQRPILLGHSAGGFVALHAVLRHPACVAALILCNTAATLSPDPDPGDPTLAERAGPDAVEVALRVFAGDVSPSTGEAFARLVAPVYAAPGHEAIPAPLFALSRQAVDVMRYFFTGPAAAYDLRNRLADILVPTLVIAGAHDWVCPPSAARTLTRGIPRSACVVFEDAGHFPFSEQPENFQRTVTDFLAGLPLTAGARSPADTPASAAGLGAGRQGEAPAP